jgi:hypothetical protein
MYYLNGPFYPLQVVHAKLTFGRGDKHLIYEKFHLGWSTSVYSLNALDETLLANLTLLKN